MMIPDPGLFHWNRLHLLESAPELESARLLVKFIVRAYYDKQNCLVVLNLILKIYYFFIILCESVVL